MNLVYKAKIRDIQDQMECVNACIESELRKQDVCISEIENFLCEHRCLVEEISNICEESTYKSTGAME